MLRKIEIETTKSISEIEECLKKVCLDNSYLQSSKDGFFDKISYVNENIEDKPYLLYQSHGLYLITPYRKKVYSSNPLIMYIGKLEDKHGRKLIFYLLPHIGLLLFALVVVIYAVFDFFSKGDYTALCVGAGLILFLFLITIVFPCSDLEKRLAEALNKTD